MNETRHTPVPADAEVLITRVFHAPRALVFKAWSDTAHLLRWFAPNGCSIEYRQFEFRSGGKYLSCIHTPNGHQCWCAGDYREVVAPERIVMTMAVADASGNRVAPTAVGMDAEWPEETVLTVTFTEQDGKTTMTLRQTVSEALAKRTGAHPSWLQMFDRLAEELANGELSSNAQSKDIYP